MKQAARARTFVSTVRTTNANLAGPPYGILMVVRMAVLGQEPVVATVTGSASNLVPRWLPDVVRPVHDAAPGGLAPVVNWHETSLIVDWDTTLPAICKSPMPAGLGVTLAHTLCCLGPETTDVCKQSEETRRGAD